jgi:hypothetical protein
MENTDQAEANHARALRSFHSAKEHWRLKGHWALKEKGIFLHFVFWVVGLQVLLLIALFFILLVAVLSGVMSEAEIDELSKVFEHSKRLEGVLIIVVTVFAYRLATGTYKGLGLFLGKLWGAILLSGLGILAALSVAPLVKPVLGEEITFILLGGIPGLIFFIFAVFIWPRRFFYQAVEKARNATKPLSG